MNLYTNVFAWGSKIYVRGVDNNGPYQSKDDYYPTLYVNSQTESKLKLLDGTHVKEIKPGNMYDCKEFLKTYEDVGGFPIYGQTNFSLQYISDKFPDNLEFNKKLIKIHTWDIETESEYGFPDVGTTKEKILLIAVHDSQTDKIIQFGWKPHQKVDDDVEYVLCNDEKDMLVKFINYHVDNYPDIITGWYSNFFDVPYVARRIEILFGTAMLKRLSPFGIVQNEEKNYKGTMEYDTKIFGISCIDYLDLYKKFTFDKRENYRLDTIAEIELNENKIDHSEYPTFKEFYTKGWEKFCVYNAHDARIVSKLDNKLKLMEVMFAVAYMAKINYEDVFSPVKTWDTLIYNYLRSKNIVIPQQQIKRKEEFEGAYVKDPKTGRYNWVVCFDLQSLYPHLIMQYAMSPENILSERKTVELSDLVKKKTNLDFLKEENLTMTANGCLFKREPGIFPVLMNSMFNMRSSAKKQMLKLKQEAEHTESEELDNKISSLHNLQQSLKILLNSLYGAMSNVGFRYYDIRIAEGITLSGQLSIKWMERKINEFLNKALGTNDVDYIIAIDTDSLYVNFETLINKTCEGKTTEQKVNYLDKFCNEVMQTVINNSYQELAEYVNAHEQKMFMKREKLCDVGIWTGKKRYALNVYDNEGVRYKEPKIAVTGLEMIRSDTPKKVKELLNKTLELIIKGSQDQVQEYILKVEDEFKSFEIDEIAKPTGVQGVKEYSDSKTIYKKGCPIHVRGSLLYNHYVKELNLTDKYEYIKESDKIRYVYLKTPNHIKENIIAFPQTLPREFQLEKYIDYDTQFEKVFLKPIETVLEAVGWTAYKTNSMEDLFG